MNSKKLFNVLEGFDFNALSNPEFKEDSVREEIILPIIKGLGYRVNKPNQIIRSRNLIHPFVSIGSKQKKISIIPDYLFEVNDKPSWILDAKSPTESILKSKHVEQAYSYAIHSEVRVKLFALCNGKEFVLFNTEKFEPVMHFDIRETPAKWGMLKEYLAPENVVNNGEIKLKKDFGLHLKRLGFDSFKSLIFQDVPLIHIAQMDPDYYSFSASLDIEKNGYAATFDFDKEVFEQLKDKIPVSAFNELKKRESESRKIMKFGNHVHTINIDCRIGEILEENNDEIFLPLRINKILNS